MLIFIKIKAALSTIIYFYLSKHIKLHNLRANLLHKSVISFKNVKCDTKVIMRAYAKQENKKNGILFP